MEKYELKAVRGLAVFGLIALVVVAGYTWYNRRKYKL
jgi:membrane protein DedA with SNARE-associated domain